MDTPLVSVIIPTYRRPDTLDIAINSVLEQTYINVEVIVVDDNNPESEGRKLTENKMLPFANNPRVIYLKHEKNKNGSAARNTGARFSKAKYIAFLDDDDIFLPTKIQNQVEQLEKLPSDYGASYTSFYTKKPGSKPILENENRSGDVFFESLSRQLYGCFGSNLLVKKSAFDEIGGFDESFIRNQDVEFCTRLFYKYKLSFVSTPGLIVNVHFAHSYYDPVEISKQYMQKFKPYVDELPINKQKEFYSIYFKYIFFVHLRIHKNLKKCIQMIYKREISLFEAITVLFDTVVKTIKVLFQKLH